MNKELVNHPSHYCHSDRKECWEEMREIFGDESVAIFDVLSAYKYLYRAGTKDGNPADQDRAKIDAYIKHCQKLIGESKHKVYMNHAAVALEKFLSVYNHGFNPYQE